VFARSGSYYWGHKVAKGEPQKERCDACRTMQSAPLERRALDRVEVVMCRDQGPCIARARASGVWKMQEGT